MSSDGVSVEPDALSVWRKGKTELVWYPGNPQDKVEASFYSGSTVAAAIQNADSLEELEEVFNER